MFDGELGSELSFDRGEDFLTLVHVHVGNARVTAQRIVIAAERPDVDVVNFGDVFDGKNDTRDFFNASFARTPFEKDVSGFPENSDRGVEDENSDGETQERVDPMRAGEMHDDGADDNGDIGEGIAEIVNEDAAKIEVGVAADQG